MECYGAGNDGTYIGPWALVRSGIQSKFAFALERKENRFASFRNMLSCRRRIFMCLIGIACVRGGRIEGGELKTLLKVYSRE